MRKANEKMTNDERDRIMLLLEKEFSIQQVADIIGRSTTIVRQVKRVYELARTGDVEAAHRQAMTSNNEPLFQWACERNGVQPVQAKPPEKPEQKPARSDNTPANMDDVESAIHVAAAKLMDRMDRHMEAPLKKMDAALTVMQSCSQAQIMAAKAVEGDLNANADILVRELKGQSESLATIKKNTRPVIDNRVR